MYRQMFLCNLGSQISIRFHFGFAIEEILLYWLAIALFFASEKHKELKIQCPIGTITDSKIKNATFSTIDNMELVLFELWRMHICFRLCKCFLCVWRYDCALHYQDGEFSFVSGPRWSSFKQIFVMYVTISYRNEIQVKFLRTYGPSLVIIQFWDNCGRLIVDVACAIAATIIMWYCFSAISL